MVKKAAMGALWAFGKAVATQEARRVAPPVFEAWARPVNLVFL